MWAGGPARLLPPPRPSTSPVGRAAANLVDVRSSSSAGDGDVWNCRGRSTLSRKPIPSSVFLPCFGSAIQRGAGSLRALGRESASVSSVHFAKRVTLVVLRSHLDPGGSAFLTMSGSLGRSRVSPNTSGICFPAAGFESTASFEMAPRYLRLFSEFLCVIKRLRGEARARQIFVCRRCSSRRNARKGKSPLKVYEWHKMENSTAGLSSRIIIGMTKNGPGLPPRNLYAANGRFSALISLSGNFELSETDQGEGREGGRYGSSWMGTCPVNQESGS